MSRVEIREGFLTFVANAALRLRRCAAAIQYAARLRPNSAAAIRGLQGRIEVGVCFALCIKSRDRPELPSSGWDSRQCPGGARSRDSQALQCPTQSADALGLYGRIKADQALRSIEVARSRFVRRLHRAGPRRDADFRNIGGRKVIDSPGERDDYIGKTVSPAAPRRLVLVSQALPR